MRISPVESDDDRWYDVDGRRFDSVTRVLGQVYGHQHWTKRRAEWEIDEGAYYRLRGRIIHKAVEILATRRPLNWSSIAVDCQPQMEAFHQWTQDFRVQFIDGEVYVASQQFAYAGRLDVAAMLPDTDEEIDLVDVKTGAEDRLVGPQVDAYRTAYRETYPGAATRSISRSVLYLRADGTYKYEPLTRAADLQDFMNALAAYRSAKTLGAY